MSGSMMGRGSRRGGRGLRPRKKLMTEINVTPFVDVMLVLLIIFMLAAPMMTVGVQVDLPDTDAAALETDDTPITIAMRKNGDVLLQEIKIDPANLIVELRALSVESKAPRVFIQAAGDIPYERVIQLMGQLNASGFKDIGLITGSNGAGN